VVTLRLRVSTDPYSGFSEVDHDAIYACGGIALLVLDRRAGQPARPV
jgi:hypothetical protein